MSKKQSKNDNKDKKKSEKKTKKTRKPNSKKSNHTRKKVKHDASPEPILISHNTPLADHTQNIQPVITHPPIKIESKGDTLDTNFEAPKNE